MTQPSDESPLDYRRAGVAYGQIDPAKRLAQEAAAATAGRLARWRVREVAASRGESAYVWEEGDCYRAFVVEGLGTKSLVADAMRPISGRSHYEAIAQDTVAMIVNDLASVGARPQVVNAFWAAGSSAWFEDHERREDLVRGWAAACEAVGATWGGGETEVLPDVLMPEAADLAGACIGIVQPKSQLLLGNQLVVGDAIVLVASSGIHANGLTLARRVAERLPDGYATAIGDGMTYGEALLLPTTLYPPVVAACLDAGLALHYVSNITGHGWRKLMRAPCELGYVIRQLPPVPRVLQFLVDMARLDEAEAYGTLNMGAGLALYLTAADAPTAVDIAHRLGLAAWVAGTVEAGPRRVVIEPLGIVYEGASLTIRSSAPRGRPNV